MDDQEKNQKIVDFILEVDFMDTKQFCEKFNYPVPYYTGCPKETAQLFIKVDVWKWKEVINFTKQIIRNK